MITYHHEFNNGPGDVPSIAVIVNMVGIIILFQFLPPADEVWGKVIFSQACVKNSVLRGCLVLGSPGPEGVPGLEGCLVWGVWSRGCLVETPQVTTAVGNTHPTGMHSSLLKCFLTVEEEHTILTNSQFYNGCL